MADVTTLTVRGKASFAKVLKDQLSLNFSKDSKEWKIDVEIDEDTVKVLKKNKIADKVRRSEETEKDDGSMKPAYLGGRPFLSFRQSEFKRDGTPNLPIEVKDILGKPWDQGKEIGNGSVIDIKFAVIDNGAGKKKGMYPRAIRVLEHVPYERKAFDELDKQDPYYKAALEAQAAVNNAVAEPEVKEDTFRQDFGLDDLDDDLDDIV